MADHDYFTGDIKLLWQDQISGKIDLDYGNFLGALKDLQVDPNWQDAFAAIKHKTGMSEFIGRL